MQAGRDGKNSLLQQDWMDMTDDGIKITLRMGTEELQALEDFMGERDLENKSVFIREAIKRYMETYDSPAGQVSSESGIFVRFSELHMDALNQIVQRGISLNEEEFVRKCVLDRIVPKTIEEDALSESFRTAQRNAALK